MIHVSTFDPPGRKPYVLTMLISATVLITSLICASVSPLAVYLIAMVTLLISVALLMRFDSRLRDAAELEKYNETLEKLYEMGITVKGSDDE